MAEEIEVKVEETTEVAAETENRKESAGKSARRPRRENRRPEKVSDGLEKRMVNLNAISKVTKGGKTLRYDALMVVGDKNGKVGIGLAKALEGKTKVEQAYEVGQAIGAKAVKLGIKKVVFDRGGYIYTGRVQKLADGARAAGLEF